MPQDNPPHLRYDNLEPSAYTISFNALIQRYGVSQGTVSHRIKQLRLKTRRRGSKTFLTDNQLAQLDELHRFLQENPSSTIKEFLIYSSNRLRPSLNDDSIDDSISIQPLEQVPQSDQTQALLQSSNDKSLITEEYRRLIEEQRRIIGEQRRTINDYGRIIDEFKLERENNMQEIHKCNEMAKEIERGTLILKHKLGKYKSYIEMWQDFWLNTFPYPLSEEDAHSIYGAIWIKTKLSSNDASARGSNAAPVNERLPKMLD